MKHIYSTIMKLIVSILVLQLVFISANAQWSTQSNVNNLVCTSAGNQERSDVVSDGSGGAIITWVDSRTFATSNYDIYAQRIDANGTVLWTTNGVAVCTAANYQERPAITSDGSGGAIITWQDYRDPNGTKTDIYAQRINASGVAEWITNGVVISNDLLDQAKPVIISDGNGGAIISWWHANASDIYAQRINANGTNQWTNNGVLLTSPTAGQQFQAIASDGAGGAIITYIQYTGSITNSPDIYAQRIDASGNIKWTANGVAICTAAGSQGNEFGLRIVSDGSSGAVVTWEDGRNGVDNNIYAQRINADGAIQWTANGVAICTQASHQQYTSIGSDGSGGGIIAWADYRNNAITSNDIFAQRIDGTGNIRWTADGVVISDMYGTQVNPRGCPIISDGNGGAIIIWDSSISAWDVYGQRINPSGAVQWVANGVRISDATSSQYFSAATSDGKGGAIIAWDDFRSGSSDIYAQNINADGTLGNIATSVEKQSSGTSNLNLKQNYPNPFEKTTKIRYEITNSQLVTLKVYDLFGNEIKTLVNEEQPAGIYEVDFDGSKIASGTYVIKLQSGILNETKKMILMK